MKRCIGTYETSQGIALLYQVDAWNPGWVTNLCYEIPGTTRLYSPNMANIVLNSKDHNGQKRDSTYWNTFVLYSHMSYVLK